MCSLAVINGSLNGNKISSNSNTVQMGSLSQIPKTMKAGQWDPVQKEVIISELPVPSPGPGEFLVKIHSASLCHSDMMSINQANASEGQKPVTLGHEGVGHIASFHPSARNKGFKEGDAVGFLYVRGVCFECEGCLTHNMLCTEKAPLLQGFGEIDGFFAEYALVDYHNAVVLDPKLWDLDRASAVFCAGITAFHSVDSSELSPGDWFGVVGAGGLGQLATQYAKAMGCKVAAIDIADENLAECKKQGADLIFNSMTNKNYAEELKKATGGGCKTVAVYTNAEPAFATATPLIKLGGILMVIGLPKSNAIPVNAMDIVLGKYRIKADSTSIPQRMVKATDFTAKHGIRPVVEVKGGLEALPGMIEDMMQGRVKGRTGVVFR
ncbi:hypothetical protein MKZ38_006735 [Zalerion maritima]|uniref:Enoyl reductase (ER) domain-containing protein n=1 Tax=Zalerion maritima TaxID=339359 RepID=A0AAD5RNC4_9PEZI|nr:hypothetical protein MKZ38_006735 [Zalerion maritima]